MATTKLQIKKELQKMGVKVHGNYVYKKDLKKLLNKIEASVGNVSMEAVNVDCLYDEITGAHSTNAPDTYYISYDKLPEAIKQVFEKVEPVVDESRYTVGKPTAFLRIAVITKDKAELDMEIHLGDLSEPDEDTEQDEYSEDEMEETEETDRDEYFQDQASEMKANFDWRMQDVYFEVVEEPEEMKESFEEWKKQIDEYSQNLLGLTPDDISGDYRWRHLYDEGFTVEEAYNSWEEDLPGGLYEKVKQAKEEN